MATSILCVGTELLLGQIHDTNSGYIAQELVASGIDSFEQRKVGDNFERIKNTLISMLEISDSVIVTGGLGPTHDDITREVTAQVMGVELVLDETVEKNMRDIFSRRGRDMPEINLRQAMVPVGATVIPNPLGTAPGLICPLKVGMTVKHIFLVPGVPHEMKPMIKDVVVPFISATKNSIDVIVNRTLKSWGLPESELSEELYDLVEECDKGDVKIGFLARGINGIYIKISMKAKERKIAESEIAKVEEQILAKVGKYVYAYDDDSMESIVAGLLREKGATLSIAESFTGGLICSRLVEVEGASDVLKGGIVAYQVEAKHDVLNIDFEDVYSLECAEKMAKAALEKFQSDFAISTTGVSGPGSQFVNGVEHKQGEVYIGIASKEFATARKIVLGGDRQRVREYGTISALNLLREVLLEKADLVGDSSE